MGKEVSVCVEAQAGFPRFDLTTYHPWGPSAFRLVSCHVHTVGSFLHQQPGLIHLHGHWAMDVCQEFPEGPTGPHLWTQETQPEGRRWCPAEGVGGSTHGRRQDREGRKAGACQPCSHRQFPGRRARLAEGSNMLCRS